MKHEQDTGARKKKHFVAHPGEVERSTLRILYCCEWGSGTCNEVPDVREVARPR